MVKDLTNGVEWSQWRWLFQTTGFNQGWGKVPEVRSAGGTRVWYGRVWGKPPELLGAAKTHESDSS